MYDEKDGKINSFRTSVPVGRRGKYQIVTSDENGNDNIRTYKFDGRLLKREPDAGSSWTSPAF